LHWQKAAPVLGLPRRLGKVYFVNHMDAALGALVAHLLDGDSEAALAEARRLRAPGLDGQRLVVEALEAAMDLMSAKCTTEQFNLLEIMLTGRAAMAVAREAVSRGRSPLHQAARWSSPRPRATSTIWARTSPGWC
jgi:hypothetical protein